MKLFHGSPTLFQTFALCQIRHGHADGFGIYLSSKLAVAQKYGKYIYQVDYPLQKALSSTEITLSTPQICSLILHLNQQNDYLTNWQGVLPENTPLRHLTEYVCQQSRQFNKSDVDLVNDFANSCGSQQDVIDWLLKNNYNHSIGCNDDVIAYDLKTLNKTIIRKEHPVYETNFKRR